MKTVLVILGIVFVLLTLGLAFKPREPKFNSLEELERYLDKMVQTQNPPGVSVAVVKDNEIRYQYSTGKADAPNGFKATNETVYHWWSMTKVVTAIGILQLSEQGMIELDAPVTDYLDFFEVDYGKYTGEITIRQLLRHSSGLPDTVPAIIGWVHTEDVIYDQVEQVHQYLSEYDQLRFAPDSQSAYSNYGYMVLGAIIAEVTGESYEAYVAEHILKPAKMNHTGFLYAANLGANEAKGSHPVLNYMTPLLPFYLDLDSIISERTGLTLWFNRLYLDVTPSSGLIGPAADVVRLLVAIQTPGVLLSEESLESMLPLGLEITERPLGWAEFGLEDRKWVQHSGGGPGFATVMRYYPNEQLGIAVMANGTNLDRNKLVEELASLSWD
jgi:CubicO group peptidase (beta-lactamase class C family)